jgi:NADH-quinone oxidoreductase subunit C
MFGISFRGHPDLRRMYMPEEYEHFPLRKDFPLMGVPDSIPLPRK